MVIKKIKNNILKYTPKKIKDFFGAEAVKAIKREQKFALLSYSQEGEDLILQRIFGDKKIGFYVDVGAHHPKRFSNTYLFYKKGWRGINIDAMPGSMKAFEKERPEDINLEVGISKVSNELDYYMFNEPALNTFSKIEAEKKDSFKTFKIQEIVKIKTYPLQEIISKYLDLNQTVDYINIDVEGLDLEVIESNDWNSIKPKVVLIELQNQSIKDVEKDKIYEFLTKKGYVFFAKTYNTSFFVCKQ